MLADVTCEIVGVPSPVGVGENGWGGFPCNGGYWRPADARPKVAFIAAHYNLDFSQHYLGARLARRGYGFLGWNTRFAGNEHLFIAEHAVAELSAGVRWLKENAGVETVVLIGNSGGGSLLATYQSQAVSPSLTPIRGMRPVPASQSLIPGDLYVSIAAHPDRADLITGCLDPSVTDELDPAAVDPSLDMYSPSNGPSFTEDFQERYRAAQAVRNRRITKWVHDELDRLEGTDLPISDRIFTVHRRWADLRFVDPAIDPSSRPTPACWIGDPRRANYGVFGIGAVCTLRTWLSMWSLDDSQLRGPDHLPKVTVPALVIGAEADTGIFPSHARFIHDTLGSSDKQLHMLAGDHYFREPDGARDAVSDLVVNWTEDRL
jgi:hypothetical protein